jgi:hypothetical protein
LTHPARRKWTLNWSEVTPDIVIGSCPRSPDDVVRPCRCARVLHHAPR